jgi:hypothetical protein
MAAFRDLVRNTFDEADEDENLLLSGSFAS